MSEYGHRQAHRILSEKLAKSDIASLYNLSAVIRSDGDCFSCVHGDWYILYEKKSDLSFMTPKQGEGDEIPRVWALLPDRDTVWEICLPESPRALRTADKLACHVLDYFSDVHHQHMKSESDEFDS